MGADLHFFVEKFNINTNKWEYLSPDGSSPYTDSDLYKSFSTFYSNRNYRLFSVLASVRNYTNIEPISFPRGCPVDSCNEIVKHIVCWAGDAHSITNYLLSELLDFDWNKQVTISYELSLEEYKKYKKSNFLPDKRTYYTTDSAALISNLEMDEMLKNEFDSIKYIIESENSQKLVTVVSVDGKLGSYKKFVDSNEWFEVLNKLKTYGDPKLIRCVIFFDN